MPETSGFAGMLVQFSSDIDGGSVPSLVHCCASFKHSCHHQTTSVRWLCILCSNGKVNAWRASKAMPEVGISMASILGNNSKYDRFNTASRNFKCFYWFSTQLGQFWFFLSNNDTGYLFRFTTRHHFGILALMKYRSFIFWKLRHKCSNFRRFGHCFWISEPRIHTTRDGWIHAQRQINIWSTS